MFKKLKEISRNRKEKILLYANRETDYIKLGFWGLVMFLVGGLSLGLIGQWFTNGISNFLGAISSYPAIIANCGISMLIFYFFDRVPFRGIGTIKLLKKKPLYYVIILGYFTMIICVSILKS